MVLLGIDAAIIGLYVGIVWLAVHTSLPDVPRFLRISGDATLGEIFGYLKWLAVVVLLWSRRRMIGDPVAAAFAAVFAIVLADDMLRIHERVGDEISELFGINAAMGLDPDDFGELITWAALGVVIVWLIWRGMRRGTKAQRRLGWAFSVILAALVGVGIGIDMLERILVTSLETSVWFRVFLHVLEDGGEMVFGSFAAALALAAWPGLSPPARS